MSEISRKQTLSERKLNRLKGHDYSKRGVYFVTICVRPRMNHFGKIVNGRMVLNTCGKIVEKCWNDISHHFPNTKLDDYVVMPDHVHGIIFIQSVTFIQSVGNNNHCSLRKFDRIQKYEQTVHGDPQYLAWQSKWSKSLSSMIRGFKIGVTKWASNHQIENFHWQKSFHDHIIRDKESLEYYRAYIKNNPII